MERLHRADYDHNVTRRLKRRRLRDRRHDHAARVRDPARRARRASSARRATRGTSSARPAAPPAAPPRRSPRAWCRSRTATTAAARSASPPRAAASSASSPRAGASPLAPELGDSSLGIDGVLTRTVADTAAILDVLAGYEPGDATWAPPPAEPFAQSAAARAGQAADRRRRRCRPSPTRSSTRCAARAVADAAELLRSLGHEVEEVDPPWQAEGLSELFGAVFSTHISRCRSPTRAWSPGVSRRRRTWSR